LSEKESKFEYFLSYILGFCGFSVRLVFLIGLCSGFGSTDGTTNATTAASQAENHRHQDPEED